MLSHSAPDYVIQVYAGNRKYKTNFYRNLCRYDVTAKYPSEKTKQKTELLLLKADCRRLGQGHLFSSSSLKYVDPSMFL